MVAEVGADRLELTEVHRFPNGAVDVGGSLHWDVLGLHREILAGLRLAAASGPVHGIGIDSWAVDYGLLDAGERLLGNPFAYRDSPHRRPRRARCSTRSTRPSCTTAPGSSSCRSTRSTSWSPRSGTPALEQASTLLLLPDLLGYWLTGRIGAEPPTPRPPVCTTCARALGHRPGRPGRAPLGDPAAAARGRGPGRHAAARGRPPGRARPPTSRSSRSARTTPPPRSWPCPRGGEPCGVHLLGDVVARRPGARRTGPDRGGPARRLHQRGRRRRHRPVPQERDGAVGALGVVAGVGAGRRRGRRPGRPARRRQAADPLRTVVDINHPSLLPPGTGPNDGMPPRLAALARAAGEPVPETPAEVARCILDSLALAYRRHVREAAESGRPPVDVVHVVGGGSRNELLCQLTADACGVPVLAGPDGGVGARQRPGPGADPRVPTCPTWPRCVTWCGVPTRCGASSRATTSTGRRAESRARPDDVME